MAHAKAASTPLFAARARSLWTALAGQPARLALLIGGAALAVYVPTLAPGLLWGGGDFATFQTRLYTGEIGGSIFGHSLWVILARPFIYLPVRDVAYRANLASAVFASGASALVFLCGWRLTRSACAALLGTAALMLSHTFWTYAVMPKVYSLNALLLAACLYLLLCWGERGRPGHLYGAAFLYGLSWLNHLVMATAAAGLAAYVWLVIGRRGTAASTAARQVSTAGAFFVLGLLPYLALVLLEDHSATTAGTIWAFVRGLLTAVAEPKRLLLGVAAGTALLVYQFPLTLPAVVYGLRRLWQHQRPEAWLLALVALGNVLFILGATDPRTGGEYVWNLHYYLQTYVVVALWLAVGLAGLWTRLAASPFRLAVLTGLVAVAPVLAYIVAPMAARPFTSHLPGFRELPGRDTLTYVLAPWKHNETGARRVGEGILASLPAGGHLFADYSLWSVVNYLQVVEGTRPDVRAYNLTIVPDHLAFIQAHAGEGELFLADINQYYDLAAIEQHFEIMPHGSVYRLVPQPVTGRTP